MSGCSDWVVIAQIQVPSGLALLSPNFGSGMTTTSSFILAAASA